MEILFIILFENYYVNDQNKIYKKVGDVTEEIYVGGENVTRKDDRIK